MASILQPFSNIFLPGMLQVPGGQLRIDFSNGFAYGLIGAWVPGATGGIDLCGNAKTMSFQTASGVYDATPEGVGLKSIAINTNMSTTIGTTSAFSGWSQFTMFSRWMSLGNAISGSPYFSIMYDNIGSAPFVVASIDDNGSTNNFRVDWNDGASFGQLSTSQAEPAANTMFDIAATWILSGTVQFYFNGVAGSSAAAATLTPAVAATTYICIGGDPNSATRYSNATCLCAYIWRRALRADEILALHLDPYVFLLPDEYDMPTAFLPPPPPAFTLMAQIVT